MMTNYLKLQILYPRLIFKKFQIIMEQIEILELFIK